MRRVSPLAGPALLLLAACQGAGARRLGQLAGTWSYEEDTETARGRVHGRSVLRLHDDGQWAMTREASVDGKAMFVGRDSGEFVLAHDSLALHSGEEGIIRFVVRGDTLRAQGREGDERVPGSLDAPRGPEPYLVRER